MATEYRVLGPPGTGKTEWIRRQVEAFVERGEYEARDIVLASFTRAAAAVLAGRVNVPRQNIATIHALAFRAVGRPPIAEAGALAKEWNEKAPITWRIGKPTADAVDGISMPDQGVGEQLGLYTLARSRMVPKGHSLWARSAEFAKEWERFKVEHEAMDFCDLLEFALTAEEPFLPGGAPVLIVDEAQDLVPLQWALVRQWAADDSCERFIVAGDPAQVLYGFAGADPTGFMQELPEGQQRLLTKSYRMPRAVHEHAEDFLKRHSGKVSQGRNYAPRDSEGLVRRILADWRRPEEVIDLILEEQRSLMVLGSCAYMLQPLIAQMRERGIPFHNPYRASNGSWNPLGARSRSDEGLSTLQKVLKFVAGEPDGWPSMVKAQAFLMRGAKKHATDDPSTLSEWITLDTLKAWHDADLDWLADNVLKQYQRPVAYAGAVVARHGAEALERPPRVIPSTMHAAKGGESDVVVIFPDVSAAAWNEMSMSREGEDAAVRLGYVAMTRAREELVLCAPVSMKALWA